VYEEPADGHARWASTGCLSAQHESRLFLVNDDAVRELDHERYVALARGEAVDEFVDQRFILVDWYLRMDRGQPEAVVNETCSWLVFDGQGSLDMQAAHVIDAEAVPTEAQWVQIRALVFGDTVPDIS
jgi:hypothetical protein